MWQESMIDAGSSGFKQIFLHLGLYMVESRRFGTNTTHTRDPPTLYAGV